MLIMRRSTKKLLKYAVAVAICLYTTFTLVKLSFGPPTVVSHSSKNIGQQKLDETEVIDWHDYKSIEADKKRKGPGEQGIAYQPSDIDEKEKTKLYSVNGFNAAASRRIAVDRSLPDIRHPGCKTVKYLKNLPSVSVVVPFHNEDNSTLIRTATSVINRAPSELIKEVILVDDHSNKAELMEPLEKYLKKYLPKAYVLRAPKREGLIRARLLGAKAATGDVLIFLDSHTEATYNWLPPLLDPIARDKKTVVCPFIDVINYENFMYRAQDEGARGAFDWELYYKRLSLLPDDLKHPTRPFKSPVMAGGLFAINREWFWTLGGYDEGLDIWGGEQYELSFKIWQCGGQMVDAPCSRIGHIYRKFAPFPNPGIGDFLSKNFKRLIVAWMDEYGEFVYMRKPNLKHVDPGDLSKSLAIRKNLKCKPFKWFMDNIAFDLVKKYPTVEPQDYAEGEIRNSGTDLCIDTHFKGEQERFGLKKCMKGSSGTSGEQYFKLTWHKDIRPKGRSVCLDVSSSEDRAPVILYNCHGSQGNQKWHYLVENKQLYHPISNQCLDSDPGRLEIYMSHCEISKGSQKWDIEKINKEAMAKFDENLL